MVVIVYDILDNKRLKKVAKYMEKNGFRTQRSVFELDVKMTEAKQIFDGLNKIIKQEDKCFLFEIKNKEDIQTNTSIERFF